MGRHKYDIHLRAFGSDAYGSGEAHRTEDPTPAALAAGALLGLEAAEGLAGGAQRPITGEGVFDVTKDLAKRVGMKAVNKLAKKSGRKIGKEIVGRTLSSPTPYAGYPTPAARPTPSNLGSRAQPEASETANVWEGKEVAGDRIREILEANSLGRKETSPSKKRDKGRLGETKKVNEAISRLLAEDD